jgi:anti-sigma B factor antagonist
MEIKDIPGHKDIKLIELSGSLDQNTVLPLREQVASIIEKGSIHLIADMSRVTACNSAGILLIVDCHSLTLKHKGSFKICRSSQRISVLLDLLGFSKIIPVYETLEMALKQ